jgi:hypothetical protein
MAELTGINLAMQTPFDAAGNLDFKRYEELIDIYLDCGVHGFVLSAGTGQHAYITEAECAKMFQLGCKRIAGRAKVTCQTSALNQDEVIRRSKTAQDVGADAVMVLPPYFEGPTHDDGIIKFYAAIDRAIGIDIVGYNIPAGTKIELTPALFRRLLQLEHFNYIKDSCNDSGQAAGADRRGQGPWRQGAERRRSGSASGLHPRLRGHHLGRCELHAERVSATLEPGAGRQDPGGDAALVGNVPGRRLLLVWRLQSGGEGRLPHHGL